MRLDRAIWGGGLNPELMSIMHTVQYALIFTLHHLSNVLTDIQNCQWTACFPPNLIRCRNYFCKYWKQLKVHYIKCRNDWRVCSSTSTFVEALLFTITRPISSPSWIIFHSHYQSYFFSTALTRMHFKICAWLHVLATRWAYQAQPIHSSWVIEWA